MQGPLALPRCTAVCPPQVRHIRRLLAEAFGEEQAALLEVGSVDGFQGREKEVIIMSAWLGLGLGLSLGLGLGVRALTLTQTLTLTR